MNTIANIPAPKRRKIRTNKAPAVVKKAAAEYKEAYKDVYHMEPRLTWDGKWIRIKGVSHGVSAKRLKEMTTLLRNRAG